MQGSDFPEPLKDLSDPGVEGLGFYVSGYAARGCGLWFKVSGISGSFMGSLDPESLIRIVVGFL